MTAKKASAKKPAKRKAPKKAAPAVGKQGVVCDIPVHQENLNILWTQIKAEKADK